MKHLPFMLAILAAAAVLGSRAEAQDYPWCAIYDVGDAAWNCGFATVEQCSATVRGIGGTCVRNTQFQPPASTGRPSQGMRKHNSHQQS
jgi:Protein of unknown function (DUF3551)